MRKIVYIIPEHKGSPNDTAYLKVATMFRKVGIKPIGVHIKWKRRTITQYLDEFTEFYNKTNRPSDEVYLFGFSYGAYVAFVAATKLKPKAAILCSISPFFKEDFRYLYKSWVKANGKTMTADQKKYIFNSLAKKVKARTLIFVGALEWGQCLRRAKVAHRLIKNNKLIIIPKARHRSNQKEYQDALKNYIVTEFK
jgi:esterase/lipase